MVFRYDNRDLENKESLLDCIFGSTTLGWNYTQQLYSRDEIVDRFLYTGLGPKVYGLAL